jgi:magnesium chelatase family protein
MKLYKSKLIDVDVPPTVERALKVAKAAEKLLVIVTPDRLFQYDKLVTHWLFTKDSNIAIEKPCPCGYYGTQYRKCVCGLDQIEIHQKSCFHFHPDAVWVDGFIPPRNIKFKNMEEPCASLLKHAQQELRLTVGQLVIIVEVAEAIALKHAQQELRLTVGQLVIIVEVAEAIAKLEESEKVKPEHLAEAISYRSKF